MSTITCQSCGMQYDGSGLQAGVQFQCTQCGEMVKVGGAKRAAPGGKRPTGRARPGGRPGPGRAAGGPPRRGPARGAPGAPMGAGPGGQNEGPQFGPPQKKGNAGLFVGLGVGAVVLVLIVVVVVASSGPSPQESQQQKAQAEAEKRKEEARKRDEQVKAENEAIRAPIDAAMEMGGSIESALRNEDSATLSGMFDWQLFAAYNKGLTEDPEKGADYLNSPIIATGEWEMGEDGRYTGYFLGEVVRGSDSLKQRVMSYIENFYYGAPELRWEKAKSELDDAGFSLELGGTKYLGKKIFITFDGAGKTKEFWLGAPKGSTDVKILNFFDGSASKNLQGIEAKNERRDDRDPMVNERDPANPDRDPGGEDEPPVDPDANLPEVKKTGAMPTEPALVNAIKELERGDSLNKRRLDNIRGEGSTNEKHATMGAIIDMMIDAQTVNDRNRKLATSEALWKVWNGFVPVEWKQEDMVYTIGFDGQSSSDLIVRRWLQVYADYLELAGGG